jgi:hypothetical protein
VDFGSPWFCDPAPFNHRPMSELAHALKPY